MTTLTADPLTSLLDRLFADAEATEPDIDAAFADLSDDEQTRMLRSKTDYAELYGRMKNLPLAVSRETGALLYMLARSSGARTIVEFGTSFGISTLHLAAALRDNGGGRLITSEFEPSKAARARDNLTAGGVIDLVEIREGDALADAQRRSSRNDRPRPARRRQVALSRDPEPAGKPPEARRADRSRQCRHEPRLPQARTRARQWVHVCALRGGCRAFDADWLTPNLILRRPASAGLEECSSWR